MWLLLLLFYIPQSKCFVHVTCTLVTFLYYDPLYIFLCLLVLLREIFVRKHINNSIPVGKKPRNKTQQLRNISRSLPNIFKTFPHITLEIQKRENIVHSLFPVYYSFISHIFILFVDAMFQSNNGLYYRC